MFNVNSVSAKQFNYSEESKELAVKFHHEVLAEMVATYGLENDAAYFKFKGSRLEESRSVEVLECNIPEEAIRSVIQYSAEAQYYYDNEKRY